VDSSHCTAPRRSPLQRVALGLRIVVWALQSRWALHRGGIVAAVAFARRAAPCRDDARSGSRSDSEQVRSDVATGKQLSSIVALVLGHMPGDTRCLVRSLVLLRLLSEQGVAGQVVLAVRRESAEAHAWVEVEGAPVSTPAGDEFVRLSEL
jgi:Transglutaminase-like superfamily